MRVTDFYANKNQNGSKSILSYIEKPNGLDALAPQAHTRKRLVGKQATANAFTSEPSDLP